jgi:hypothetical protein
MVICTVAFFVFVISLLCDVILCCAQDNRSKVIIILYSIFCILTSIFYYGILRCAQDDIRNKTFSTGFVKPCKTTCDFCT